MNRLLTTVPVDRLPGASRLFGDYCSRADSPLHGWLGGSRGAPAAWAGVLGARARVDPRLVARMQEFNAGLGAPARLLDRIARIADGSARVVVTGQQPGVLGGPLLALYKIASAVALARSIEEHHATPCVPVFWLGADDDDFAEIRDLVVLGSDLSAVAASVAAGSYRPGLRVGDIRASAAIETWGAVAPLTGAGEACGRVDRVVAPAVDFADAAARVVTWVTQGTIAVIDGREPMLRVCAADLLLEFLDSEPRIREAIDARGSELESMGYHAQLRGGGDSGLFLVREGTRHRIPMDRRDAARAEFEADITRVSPGVVARNLLQDATLAPAAVVIGPAEVAYRAQLVDVYRELRVPMPVTVPRLMATFVPAAVRELIDATGVDAALLATDPAAFARAAETSAMDTEFVAAAAHAEAVFRAETARFAALAGGRLDERAQQRLRKRLDEVAQRLAQALAGAIEQDSRGARVRWPYLPRMADVFVRDGRPQERYLSLLVPFLAHGETAWEALDALAAGHVRDALDGRVWHGVYSV
jgi:bacillithiol biosynthesis cysteine-adding enzyme BshC